MSEAFVVVEGELGVLGKQTPDVEDVTFGSELKALVEAPVARMMTARMKNFAMLHCVLCPELCQAASGRADAIVNLDQDYLSASPCP